MADNAQIIWNYFKSKGFTDCGAAGLIGNLYAESGLIPTNLQNSFQNKLGMTDSQYTSAVDNGTYNNFIRDKAGYGLAQWTYWSRKQNLLQFCQSRNKSIGDLNTQLDFLYQELTTGYSSLIQILMTTDSVLDASNAVLLQFERPANQGASVQQKRTSYGQQYYDRFTAKGGNIMTNSPLATYKRITSNKTTLSNKTLNRISIHCFVGQVTARSGVDYFATTNAECSANYVIGFDGSIGLSVEEKDRSWCTSSANNDKQAITIEVASDKTEPYQVTDEAYKSLINLIVDICQRNGKTKTIWIPNKEKALAYKPQPNEIIFTVHRWFANKSCPGTYLYNLHSQISEEVNARLTGVEEDEDMTQEKFNEMMENYLTELAMKPATWEQNACLWAQSKGLIAGDTTGNVMPKKFMTRGELATVLQRVYAELNK